MIAVATLIKQLTKCQQGVAPCWALGSQVAIVEIVFKQFTSTLQVAFFSMGERGQEARVVTKRVARVLDNAGLECVNRWTWLILCQQCSTVGD